MNETLYTQLEKRFQKLDKRSTKYRFDIEKDIEWNRIDEKGRYFSDTWLRNSAINVANIKKRPDILEYVEVLFAFNMTKTFHLFETDVVQWEPEINQANAVTQSFRMLVEEEVKHVKMFERYETKLSEMYPDIAKNTDKILDKVLADFQEKQQDRNRYETDRQYHYALWLYIMFFEEYTVWFDTSLTELKGQVQPCWKQVHHCHRLEEIQHVITDKAYIDSLEISYEEKMLVSEKLIKDVLKLFQDTHNAIYYIVTNKFPNESIYSTEFLENSRFVDVVVHASFSQTRSVAPYFDELAKKSDSIKKQEKSKTQNININFVEVTRKVLAELIDCSVDKIDKDVPFPLLGLDSLGHLMLASELEKITNTKVVNNIPYVCNTIEKLNSYFEAKDSIKP